jgi:hypothetical protein
LRGVAGGRDDHQELNENQRNNQAASAPTMAMTTLSTRICMKTSKPVAPTALQKADLADAFVDAGKHSVHDADAADDEADECDDAAAQTAFLIWLLMFSTWFSWVRNSKSSMPRWVIIKTLRACCSAGSSWKVRRL